MPTQKDCKYSQLSQLSQIRGQDKLLFRNILKHGDEELPGLGDGSDVHALVRRVRIEDGRSYGNHLPVRILGSHNGALKSSVGGRDLEFLSEEALEGVLQNLDHRSAEFRSPTAVSA